MIGEPRRLTFAGHNGPNFSGDGGAGTALVLGVLALAVALVAGLSIPLGLLVDQARLQAAVDVAAVDASHARRGLISGFPCEVANDVLHINMGTTAKCSIVGEVTRVEASVKVAGIVLTATAWAGP